MPLLGAAVAFDAIRGDKEGVRTGSEALMSNMLTSAIHADWRTNITSWAGRQAAAADDWQGVRRSLHELEGAQGKTAFPRLGTGTLRARLALHEGRNAEARELLTVAAEASADVDRLGFDASIRVSLAVAELRLGAPDAAWRALAPLVAAADATGEVGGVLLCGATLLAEVAQARWGAAAPQAGVAALERWATLAKQWRSEAPEKHATVEGELRLSARRGRSPECVAAGQSNKLIARASTSVRTLSSGTWRASSIGSIFLREARLRRGTRSSVVLDVPIGLHAPTLAPAKIRLPRPRAGLIERSGLDRRLAEALGRNSLVLLVAAGFGKTVALSRQLQRLSPDCAVAWVTADDEDDLSRLLSCLIEALEPYDLPWRISSEALAGLAAQEDGPRSAARMLLDTLAVTDVERGCIALDDLHAVSDARVFAFLDALLEGLPHNWTLVISTRTDPPLALGRLRVRRELAEFRHAELSFSLQEVEQLSRMATGQDDPAVARSLHERTQGWPAGLSLSLNTAVGRQPEVPSRPTSQKLSRRHMFEYLAEEVLTRMPDELREFLLRCSVLPELSAERCAALSAQPQPRAAELIEETERRGLFVAVLDGETLTLRLHDLFRDFLEEQLRRRYPDEVPLLLRRAAEVEVDPARKVALLLRAGAWAAAEHAVVDAVDVALAYGRIAQAKRLIDQFPVHLREQSANLAFARGLCAWHDADSIGQRDAMQVAAAQFDVLGQPKQALWARALAALGLMSSGDVNEALDLSGAHSGFSRRPGGQEAANCAF